MSFFIEEETDLEEEAEEQFDEGNYDLALSTFQQLLQKQKNTLGDTHEDTLRTQSRIAAVFEKQMKYAEALEILIELYETKLSALGILNDSSRETRCCVEDLIKKHGSTVLTERIVHRCMTAIRLEVRTIHASYLRGKYEEAFRSTITIWPSMRTFLSEDNSITDTLAAVLGKIYIAWEEYDNAIEVFNDLHTKMESQFGQHDRRTATALMRKASLLHKMCKFDEALKLYLKAYEIRSDILGLNHRNTLLSLLSVAKIHSDIGNYDEALEVMNQVLEKQKLNNDRESLRTNINIGLLHIGRRDFERALEVFQDDCELEHASKLTKTRIQTNIGNLLTRLGRYADARLVLVKAQETLKSSNHHMDTLRIYREMAATLAKAGLIVTSHALLLAVIEASIRVLGPEHSVTLSLQNDLALLYFELRQYQDALGLYTNIWRVRDKVLSKFHPDALHAKFEVARVFKRQGKTDIALKMYNEVWRVQKAIFYPQHSVCFTVELEIAETYFNRRFYSSAFKIIYELYEKKVKMYGMYHEYTCATEEYVKQFGRKIPLTGLITGTVFEKLEDVKKSLEEGDNVNARDSNGAVALHCASREGYVDILKYLLSKGAIYDIKDMYGQTPNIVASDDSTRQVLLLVERLFLNVKRCNQDEVRRILEQENCIVNARDARQRTPLQWAVKKGHQGIVQDLIDHGADPLLANEDDGTVLHDAAKNGDNEVMSILLRHISRNNPEKLREFISNNDNYLGLSPLHIAVTENSVECVNLLLQYAVHMVFDVFERFPLDLATNERIRSDILGYLYG